MLRSKLDVLKVVDHTWPKIIEECRQVLGSELHYQAMLYHCFRNHGQVPIDQLGMNVKQWISPPTTQLFKKLNEKRHPSYQGGFEPIPDLAFFSPDIQGDWRRRNRENTLRHIIGAIEVKASERAKGRLGPKEITDDIEKLAAHREEVKHLGGDMAAIMMVIDTAPTENERMKNWSLDHAFTSANNEGVAMLYLSPDAERTYGF